MYGRSTTGRCDKGARVFVCASDALFADNSVDRRSSQGYAMTLFSGVIAWRANKQDTVITSSTEVELLALSQTVKEAIFMSRLFKVMTLRLNEPLIINCDNTQTLRLLKEDSAKLNTKLRHVNIHQHWLRQEYAVRRVLFEWIPMTEIIADRFTRALLKQKFQNFIQMVGMVDISDRLRDKKRMEVLRETLKVRKVDEDPEIKVRLIY